MSAYGTSVALARLYEKTSKRDTQYFVGHVGLARVTLLPGDPAEDGTQTWRILLQEAPKAAPTASPANSSPYRAPRARRQSVGAIPDAGRVHDDPLEDLWRRCEP
jgi:hypothetical protein